MSKPTTEAGKRTAESLRKLLPHMPLTWEGIDDRLAAIEAEAVTAERARIAAALRATHERLSNDAEPKRGRCECGMDMDAHAGGFALLHHDFFIVDRLALALIDAAMPGERR